VSEGFKRDDGSLLFSRAHWAHWAHSPQAGSLRVLEPLALGVPRVPAPVLGKTPRFIDIIDRVKSKSLGRQLQSLKVVVGASLQRESEFKCFIPSWWYAKPICSGPTDLPSSPAGAGKGQLLVSTFLNARKRGSTLSLPQVGKSKNKKDASVVVVRKTDRQTDRQRVREREREREVPLRFCPAQHPKGTVPELRLVLFCCCCCCFARSDSPQWQANCL